MSYLIESLNFLKTRIEIENHDLKNNILLIIAGRGIEEIAESLPFEYIYLGMLDNTYGIASAYQAADIFVCPSIEDSGPTMINQSIMCGTPVVSFEMGVSLDLVLTGKTGYRAKIKDSTDMAQGIYEILTMDDNSYIELSNNCRELALKLYSPKVRIEEIENILLKKQEN
jgi:glycosyltransferase involved in cell wall biosynthesis